MWSGYSGILLIAMLIISVAQYILNSNNQTQMASQLSIYAYMLTFLNLVTVVIQQVILDCFAVDG
jgi:hypothetical protein